MEKNQVTGFVKSFDPRIRYHTERKTPAQTRTKTTMKMKKKKSLCCRFSVLLLAILLVLPTLSACQKNRNGIESVGGFGAVTTRDKDSNAPVEKDPSKGLEYRSINDKTCILVGIGTCEDTEIIIPSRLFEMGEVVGIDAYAFEDQTQITGVSIPDTVKSIGSRAFAGCTELRTVRLPDSIESIGSKPFFGCDNLQYNEANSADYLGNATNPFVLLVRVKDKETTTFTIPEQTKILYSEAFANCAELQEITLPESLVAVGISAFSGCEKLEQITVPNGVTELGAKAFENCRNLKTAVIGSGIKSIGKGILKGCDALESLTVPFIGETEDETSRRYLDHFFGGDFYITPENLTTSIQETVPLTLREVILTGGSRIGNHAFIGCPGLTRVEISDRMVEIGMYAFYRCSGLTEVVIPDSVVKIDIDAFRECTSLTEITIPDQVTELGGLVFYGCTGLQKIVIGKNVKELKNYVLGNCPALREIHYAGTETEWSKITKDDPRWDDGTDHYTVYYNSEGTVSS